MVLIIKELAEKNMYMNKAVTKIRMIITITIKITITIGIMTINLYDTVLLVNNNTNNKVRHHKPTK